MEYERLTNLELSMILGLQKTQNYEAELAWSSDSRCPFGYVQAPSSLVQDVTEAIWNLMSRLPTLIDAVVLACKAKQQLGEPILPIACNPRTTHDT